MLLANHELKSLDRSVCSSFQVHEFKPAPQLPVNFDDPENPFDVDDDDDVDDVCIDIDADKELATKDVLLSVVVVVFGLTSIVFLTFFMYVIFSYPSLTALAYFVQ